MKTLIRRSSCLLLTVLMVLSLSLSVCATDIAQIGEPDSYSTELNSGHRDVTCTTLNNTTALEYYTGEYTYEALSQLRGDELLQALRTLMSETHETFSTYEECHSLAYRTDCQDEDGSVLLWYTSYVSSMEGYINASGKCWNREHVWPRSLGGFYDKGAGADLHHIRPTDKSVNGKRGNEMYGIPTNGKEVIGTSGCENAVGGISDNNFFEPLDNVKGDAARICLYVYVRYGGELSKCSSITNIFQSVDVLLDWMQSDPVDTWEMGRNEVVGSIQGNRNVFIDYPELAWLLFDREVPEDMVTPSLHTSYECAHIGAYRTNLASATCGKDGYTGDMVCAACGETLAVGQSIPATGEHVFGNWKVSVEATVEAEGAESRICAGCSYKQTRSIEKLPASDEDTHSSPINVTVIAVAAIAAAAVAAGVVIVLRKKKV